MARAVFTARGISREKAERALVSLLAIPLIGATHHAALAQAPVPRTIEEVVVTAEHREASIQDTQISISVLSANAIQDLGISNGSDLGQFVPNLTTVNLSSGRTGFAVNMRGIGNNESLLTFDPSVSTYIDNVLITRSAGSLLDVLDIERIEVLRGPQGTLYGRNTIGGSLNIVSRKPGDELEASLKATIGNYNQRDLRAMLNVPLAGADSQWGPLNLRVSAATLNRDGLQDNDYPGAVQDELGTRDRNVATAQLLWQPVDRLQLLYSFDMTRIDEVPEAMFATGVNPAHPNAAAIAPYVVSKSERPSSLQVDDFNIAKTDADGHSLQLDYDLTDTMTFKSITAYREMDNSAQSDSDGTPLLLTGTKDEQSFEAFTQEFRLVGTTLANRLEYSVGFFYMDEEGEVDTGTRIRGSLSRTLATYHDQNWAVYGQSTYSLTDRLRLTGGIRYTDEEREMEKALLSASGVFTPFPAAKRNFENVSPMVSLSYDWSDSIMTYAKVSSGFQSGGFNVRDTSPVDFVQGFDEENLIAYELGIKSTFHDRYRLNASLWYSDYDDKRVNNFNPQTLGNTVRNAGSMEIYGLEAEFLAQLGNYWELGVNYGYTKPEYKEYTTPDRANPGVILDLSDISNYPYTPEHTASVNLTYEYPLDFALFKARLDWSYKDDITFLVGQPERNSQDAYDLWNARVSLEDIKGPGDSRVRVSLWGRNLTDESYFSFGVNTYSSFGFDKNNFGEPRTYGIDFAIDF